LIHEPATSSRAEDGVLEYRVATDIDEENRFRFFEQYEDEAAFGAHAETEHFERFATALPDLLAGEPSVTRFDIDSTTVVEL
jgi:quinol monooxygenase YgiN